MKILNNKLKIEFILIICASFLLSIFNIKIPFEAKNMVDNALTLNKSNIYEGVKGLIVAILGLLIVELIRKILFTHYKAGITKSLRTKLTSGILNMDFNKFNKKRNQDYISTYNNDISALAQDYYMVCIDIIFNFFSLFIYTFSLIKLNTYMAIIVFVTNLIPLIIPIFFKNKLKDKKQDYLNSLKSYNVKIGDFITGFNTIKINLMQETIKDIINKSSNKNIKKLKDYEILESISDIIIALFSYFNYFAIIAFGVYLITVGKLTAGGVLAAVAISEILVVPVLQLSFNINTFNSMKSVKKELFEILKIENNDKKLDSLKEDIKSISLKNVSFNYENNKVLKNIDLKFEKNKKYLIYGTNGSGKSTLFKLLSKQYDNFYGNIFINNKSLKEINSNSYFQKVGIMNQTPFLFNDSLKNNITLYSKEKEKEILNYIDVLNLNRIKKDILEDKIFVDSKSNLSGGEIQKINFARVLIENKSIILIDEATSAFDKKSSIKIEEYLLKKDNLTLINIQHKLNKELIELYDEIIIFNNGKIEKIIRENKESFVYN